MNSEDMIAENTGTPPPMIVAPPAQTDQEEAAGINPSAVINSLRRTWFYSLPLGLCLAVAGAVIGWLVMVPKYSASAYLRVNSNDRPLIFQTADTTSGSGTPYNLYKATQTQLLLTPLVLNAALRDDEVAMLPAVQSAEDPIVWLQDKLNVSFPGKGEIMKVSLETDSPKDCVKLINAVVDAYMDKVVDSDQEGRIKRLGELEKVYATAESKVRSTRTNLKSLAETVGTGDSESLTVAQQTALQQYGMMHDKLTSVQLQQMVLEDELAIAKQLAETKNERISQQNAAEQKPETAETAASAEPANDFLPVRTNDITRLEEQISNLESQLTSVSQQYGVRHPAYSQISRQLELYRQLLEQRVGYAEKLAAVERERRTELQQDQRIVGPSLIPHIDNGSIDVMAVTAKLNSLVRQEKILQAKVDEYENDFRHLGQSSIEVELMRSEIEAQQDILRRVGAEIERTEIEQDRTPRIQVMSEAEHASPPDRKKRFAASGAFGLFGLCLPFALLAAWDLTRSSVNDAESVSSALAVPNMGTIPKISGDPLRKNVRLGNRRNVQQLLRLRESVAAVATLIQQHARRANHRVFMVTSALAGEGKSTVACQLAESLAKSGKNVALVDFDLRRPSIDRYMKIEEGPGVSEVLHEKVDLCDVLQSNETPNLSIATAGTDGVSLYERSSSHALENLFDDLRQQFDLVIVDACPVLPIVDARIIGTYCDGTILTLLRDKSRVPAALRACEMLRDYGVQIMGTVVIGDNSGSYPSNRDNYFYDDTRSTNRVPALHASVN